MEFTVFISSLILFVGYLNGISDEDYFKTFIHQYKRNYTRGSDEYNSRFCTFKKNLDVQAKLNSSRTSNKSAWYGPTQFSDLSQDEFSEKYLSSYKMKYNVQKILPELKLSPFPLSSNQIPSRVDWREKNIVTSIKNQGSCGGCWGFSSVATIESMHAKQTGQLESLSVQEVLDCSQGYRGILAGCKGGDTCTALEWLRDKKVNLVSQEKYPTTDKPEKCRLDPFKSAGVHIKNFTCAKYVNVEAQLLKVLADVGPVAVSVDATSWANYQGGIIQYHCGENPNNHAVEIVGYDITGDVPYYIAKNSWGDKFGDHGYIYIKVGDNVCGIAQEVSTVEV